jgi:hypothetical protein
VVEMLEHPSLDSCRFVRLEKLDDLRDRPADRRLTVVPLSESRRASLSATSPSPRPTTQPIIVDTTSGSRSASRAASAMSWARSRATSRPGAGLGHRLAEMVSHGG